MYTITVNNKLLPIRLTLQDADYWRSVFKRRCPEAKVVMGFRPGVDVATAVWGKCQIDAARLWQQVATESKDKNQPLRLAA